MDKVKGREPSALMTATLPDLELVHHNQVFPLYRYRKATSADIQGGIFDDVMDDARQNPPDGYVVEDNILDEALEKFQNNYNDTTITKDDIFFYCYGILHHPGFKAKYHNGLVKYIPRLPFAPDFWTFANAGRRLGTLHVRYDQLDGHDLIESGGTNFDADNDDDWRFMEKKYRLSKPHDSQGEVRLTVNEKLEFTGIPARALEYEVNGKSALEWLADRYYIDVDKDTKKEKGTGIVNDANRLFDDPRDYFLLVKQITEMSLKTMDIVDGLPKEFE